MHKVTTLCCLAALVWLATVDSFAVSPRRPQTYQLHAQLSAGSIDRVEAALEVSGENKVVQGNKVERFKMSVLANVSFDERLLQPPTRADRSMRSIRHYDKMAVVLKLDQQELRPALRQSRSLVGVEIDPPSVTLFSPAGPLTRDELDLLEMHGASMSLLAYRLLPEGPVAIGETWKHSAALMAAMLDLDAVSQTDVQSVLRGVTGGTAEIEISGKVEGAVSGVSTQIELKANCHFDLSASRIAWFEMVTQESRSIGHVGPGLEARSRLQMKMTPLKESASLSDAALAGTKLTSGDELTVLSYESPEGGWRLAHGRDWFITGDERRRAVLRLIERGELVAQCNIHTLPDAAPDEKATLAEFQNDIRSGLGDAFGQFLQASERAGEAGYRIYRVVAAGQVEQVPIQWIYYLVADKLGRQVVCAFTIESKLLEQFGAADEQLVAALELDPPKPAAKPTPAKAPPKAD